MSRTLLRYVARLYLTLFVGVLAAVLVIYVVVDFGDRLKAFLDKPAADVALLYWLKVVVAVHRLSPAAMLLAAGAAASIVRKRGEWTAMQALGLSRWVLVGPVVGCTLALAVGLTAYDEYVVTRAGTRMDQVLLERFQTWGEYRFFYSPKQWFRVGDHVFHLRGATDDDGTLHDVAIFDLDKSFGLTRRLDAATLSPLGGARWRLTQVVERRFSPNGSSARVEDPALEVELAGTDPKSFDIRQGKPELMQVGVILSQQEIRARVGLPTQRFWLALHNRFAYPVTGVAAALLAVTLALRPSRRGHLTLALVEGLFISVALFALMVAGKTLVLSEHLSPFAAAWAPVMGLLAASAALWAFAERGRGTVTRPTAGGKP